MTPSPRRIRSWRVPCHLKSTLINREARNSLRRKFVSRGLGRCVGGECLNMSTFFVFFFNSSCRMLHERADESFRAGAAQKLNVPSHRGQDLHAQGACQQKLRRRTVGITRYSMQSTRHEQSPTAKLSVRAIVGRYVHRSRDFQTAPNVTPFKPQARADSVSASKPLVCRSISRALTVRGVIVLLRKPSVSYIAH